MKRNLKYICLCIGLTAIFFIMVNILHAFYDVTQVSFDVETIGFNHGTFFINGESSGLLYGTGKAQGALIVIFITFITQHLISGKLSYSRTDTSIIENNHE